MKNQCPNFVLLLFKFDMPTYQILYGSVKKMDVLLEKTRDYILALKKAGNFTYESMAQVSLVPVSTIRNICAGKNLKNAGYLSMMKLILSMGGNPNDAVGFDKKQEIDTNTTLALKESYENQIVEINKYHEIRYSDLKAITEVRIADMTKSCDLRIEDMKQSCEKRIQDLKEVLNILK